MRKTSLDVAVLVFPRATASSFHHAASCRRAGLASPEMDSSKLVTLGRTSLQVNRWGLGLASIGGMVAEVPHDQALATIGEAWTCGVRLFDTAPVYGYGLSERRTGMALVRAPAMSSFCAPGSAV